MDNVETRNLDLTLDNQAWECLESYCFLFETDMSQAIRDMLYTDQSQEYLQKYRESKNKILSNRKDFDEQNR